MTNPGEFQQAVEQAKVSANSQIMTERDKAESLLASATDLLNSWARETGVMQADSPSEIKAVIDRLWVNGADKAVTGAYAAAAKLLERIAERLEESTPPEVVGALNCRQYAKAILKLIPADARQASQQAYDAQMLNLKACEHIAEGDEGWEKLRNICHSTMAVAALRDSIASARPFTNQRLFDLVRHQRSELHVAELITDDEYAQLAQEHSAVKRLEDYDAAIASAEAQARLEEAKLSFTRRWSTAISWEYVLQTPTGFNDAVVADAKRIQELDAARTPDSTKEQG